MLTETRAEWARLTYPQLHALLARGESEYAKAPPLSAVREWIRG